MTNFFVAGTIIFFLVSISIIVFIVLFCFITQFIGRKFRFFDLTEKSSYNLLPIAAISGLGVVVGILLGQSREPAVGAILPAIITAMAGLFVYILGKEAAPRTLVSAIVLIFSVSLLAGASWGGLVREAYLRGQESAEAQFAKALVERSVRDFRRSLDLPVSGD